MLAASGSGRQIGNNETSKREVYGDGGEKYEWVLDMSTPTEEVR